MAGLQRYLLGRPRQSPAEFGRFINEDLRRFQTKDNLAAGLLVSSRSQRGAPLRVPSLENGNYNPLIVGGIPLESDRSIKGAQFDMRDVAFCLVENDRGEVLFVQRAYGKEKGKWSLPGGLVDRGESSRYAAYRETKEETGIVVEITHRLFTGNSHPVKVFVGRRVGGRLRFQRKECLDVRWRRPGSIRPDELAFGGDRKALRLWADIKRGLAKPERDYTSHGRHGRSGGANPRKRQRATALVINEGKYLLVQEKGDDRYSLPGGGIKRGEAALTTACRELSVGLGMKDYRAERLFDYASESGFNDHKVVLVFAGGEPRNNHRELKSFRWWDGRERLPLYPHVTSIVGRYEAS